MFHCNQIFLSENVLMSKCQKLGLAQTIDIFFSFFFILYSGRNVIRNGYENDIE